MVALKTFNNLSDARKEEIIAVCLEEFALHEYQTASLSAIIEGLNLAKGSFYRYFENKQSLYLYLLEYCTQARLRHDQTYIDDSCVDFFEMIGSHFMAKIHFDKTHPFHSAFLFNVLQEKNNDELGNIQATSKQKVLGIIAALVDRHIRKKVLRKDIPIDTISFMIFQTQQSITDFIGITYKIDFRENIRQKKNLYPIPEKELRQICDRFVEILKNGISHR